MWIKSPLSVEALFVFGVFLAVLIASAVAHAGPVSKASTPASVAGVKLDGFQISGLQLASRDDRPAEEGGTALRFTDEDGQVRVVVRVVVAADHAGARRFVELEQSAISTHLAERTGSPHGEPTFTDAKETLIIAAVANLAYSIRLVEPVEGDSPKGSSADEIASELRARIVSGVPSFPIPTVSVPTELSAEEGAPIRIDPRSGTEVRVRAEGGYIEGVSQSLVLRPFAAGRVVLIATAVDALGRVGETRLELLAR